MPALDKDLERRGRIPYEISWWQMNALLVCSHLSLLVSYTPEIIGWRPPVRDAWLAVLLAWIPGFLLALLSWWLSKRFEGQNLFQMTHSILGRFFGAIANLALVVYFLYWATLITREFSVFLASVVYLRTPEFVFSILFLILGFVGASLQIEFVARAAELSLPWVIGGLLLLIVGAVPVAEFGMVRPVLFEGWLGVFRQSATPMVIFAEAGLLVLLAMPYLNNLTDGPKALQASFGINVAFSVMTTVMLLCTFGVDLLTGVAFPATSVARLVRLGTFLERVEWILLILWLGSMGVKLSLLLLGARLGISSFLPSVRPGWVLLFATTVVFIWSLFVLPTLAHVLEIFVFRLRWRSWPHLTAELAPLLLAAVALVRGAGAKRS